MAAVVGGSVVVAEPTRMTAWCRPGASDPVCHGVRAIPCACHLARAAPR